MFTEDSGDFVSPGYPNQYGHNLVCNYTIVVHPGRFIVFDFFRANFHLEGMLLKWAIYIIALFVISINTVYAFLLLFISELTTIQVESDVLTTTFRSLPETTRPEGFWENSVERMFRIPSVLAEVCSFSLWPIETRRFPDSERSIAWQVRLHDR